MISCLPVVTSARPTPPGVSTLQSVQHLVNCSVRELHQAVPLSGLEYVLKAADFPWGTKLDQTKH